MFSRRQLSDWKRFGTACVTGCDVFLEAVVADGESPLASPQRNQKRERMPQVLIARGFGTLWHWNFWAGSLVQCFALLLGFLLL